MRKSRKRVSRKRKSSSRKRVPLERRRVSRKRQSRHRARRKSIKKHIRYRVGDAGESTVDDAWLDAAARLRRARLVGLALPRPRIQMYLRQQQEMALFEKYNFKMADLKLRQETEMRELNAKLDRKNAEELAALKQFLQTEKFY